MTSKAWPGDTFAKAAFNAGEGRVTSAQHRAKRAGLDPAIYENIQKYLPESTREYVTRVMQFREGFKGQFVC